MSNKTLKISEASKQKLNALCKLHNLNIGEAVEAMINFFDASNQNPTSYKNIQEDFASLVSKQVQTQKESILQAIKEQKAEDVAKIANKLFKDFKIELESQKTALFYASVSVENSLKTYQKRFETLEKENSTSTILLKNK
jgi:hypothetical protein